MFASAKIGRAPCEAATTAVRQLLFAKHVGGVALLIDPKNDHAAGWYESYGAVPLLDAPRSLVLPFAVAVDALRRGI